MARDIVIMVVSEAGNLERRMRLLDSAYRWYIPEFVGCFCLPWLVLRLLSGLFFNGEFFRGNSRKIFGS